MGGGSVRTWEKYVSITVGVTAEVTVMVLNTMMLNFVIARATISGESKCTMGYL